MMRLRPARSTDLPRMNELALESKAVWGYEREQLDAWKADLETKPETIDTWPTVVAERDGTILGFAQLDPSQEPWELVSLWIDQQHMRKGIGRALLCRAQGIAASAKQQQIAIDSDPNALAFYVACGAVVVALEAAPINGQPERARPQLLLPTNAA